MSGGAETVSVDDQLAAIRSLGETLDRAAVDYWLFGGWAVDFWVGEVTRPHDDIDVAAWRRDYDAIGSALRAAGWEHTPEADEMVGTRYRLGAVLVEFTFIEATDDGGVVIRMPAGAIMWSSTHFGDIRRELREVTCRTIPLSVLKGGKSNPREGVTEGAKDRADHLALSRLDGLA